MEKVVNRLDLSLKILPVVWRLFNQGMKIHQHLHKHGKYLSQLPFKNKWLLYSSRFAGHNQKIRCVSQTKITRDQDLKRFSDNMLTFIRIHHHSSSHGINWISQKWSNVRNTKSKNKTDNETSILSNNQTLDSIINTKLQTSINENIDRRKAEFTIKFRNSVLKQWKENINGKFEQNFFLIYVGNRNEKFLMSALLETTHGDQLSNCFTSKWKHLTSGVSLHWKCGV